jgi:hypothetical protein
MFVYLGCTNSGLRRTRGGPFPRAFACQRVPGAVSCLRLLGFAITNYIRFLFAKCRDFIRSDYICARFALPLLSRNNVRLTGIPNTSRRSAGPSLRQLVA